MRPPKYIDDGKVLRWAFSGSEPFGVIKYSDGRIAAEIYGLAICQYDGDSKIYRFSCDKDWETEQDAGYGSIEEAMNTVPAQYRGQEIKWQEA
ncbi:hypothetical protein ACUR5C_15095 [Aliikangiella sp. IMCC44653]